MTAEITDRVRNFTQELMPIIVGTKRRSGIVKMDPAWYEFRDDEFWLNSWRGSRWLDNIERDGVASLLLIDPRDMTRVVHCECALVATNTEGAAEHLERLMKRYASVGHEDAEPQQRVIIRLRALDVRSTLDWVATCSK